MGRHYGYTPWGYKYERVSGKSWWTTMWLFFMGGCFLGFHYFYVGRTKRGWIALFTLNLCGIGLVCDFLSIFTGNFKDCYGYRIPLFKKAS